MSTESESMTESTVSLDLEWDWDLGDIETSIYTKVRTERSDEVFVDMECKSMVTPSPLRTRDQ